MSSSASPSARSSEHPPPLPASSSLPTPPSSPPAAERSSSILPRFGTSFRPSPRPPTPPSPPSRPTGFVSTLLSAFFPPPPFLDPQTGERLFALLADAAKAPIWSKSLERTFHERSYNDWQRLNGEQETDTVDLRRLRREVAELKVEEKDKGGETGTGGPSSALLERMRELEAVKTRMKERLCRDGLVLLTMRLHYWAYELRQGISPTRIPLRLEPFPEAYEPSLRERDAWEGSSGATTTPDFCTTTTLFDTQHDSPDLPVYDRIEPLIGSSDFWQHRRVPQQMPVANNS